MARHGAEQRALADAAAAENADALPFTARQQAVDGADSGDQRLRNVLAIQRIGGLAIEAVSAFRLDWGAAIDGLAEAVDHPAEQVAAYRHTRIVVARSDRVAQLQAVDLLQRHGEDAAVAEADHLGADGPSGGRAHFAEFADRHAGTARFHQQPDHFSHLPGPAQGRDAVELR